MKTIQEYFAEMSAAGLLPDWDNVWAYSNNAIRSVTLASYDIHSNERSYSIEDNADMTIYGLFHYFDKIQLRLNGKDLVKLEWQKPTEEDVGKMCWFYSCDYSGFITLSELGSCDEERMKHDKSYLCLLATHGRLCPEPSDFKEVYKC